MHADSHRKSVRNKLWKGLLITFIELNRGYNMNLLILISVVVAQIGFGAYGPIVKKVVFDNIWFLYIILY